MQDPQTCLPEQRHREQRGVSEADGYLQVLEVAKLLEHLHRLGEHPVRDGRRPDRPDVLGGVR